MTDRAAPSATAAAARKKPRILPTVLLGLATFGVIFGFLAFQLSNGNDPALGDRVLASANDAKATRADAPVVNRRVIKTRIVHLPPKPTVGSSSLPVTSSAPSPSPVTSAPTTSPAPAPAPAPAPVTSSS